MKKLLFLLTFCAAALCASASNKYVNQATGSDSNSGDSWDKARATIAAALSSRVPGDTVFIAEGTYKENIAAKSGVALFGGYSAETGERDLELYETALDGTGKDTWLLVKYDSDPEERIVLDGLVFQNANHATWGGAAIFARGNMTINNCVFRNCVSGSKAGGIFVDPSTDAQAIISNCLFENCSNSVGDQAAAISFEDKAQNALVENCIIRSCTGDVMIYTRAGVVVRNCVIYNNHASKNGCLYGKGTFINNTVCNNTGIEGRYAGARVEGKVVNTVFWGNTAPNASNVNYVAGGTGSSNNIGDAGSGITLGLAGDNNAADGPNFRNPTAFAGVPKTDAEKAAVTSADFSLTEASTALIDKGDAAQAPEKDIIGTSRNIGTSADIGAYEYDPEAVIIAVTGVTIVPSSIEIIEGRTGTLVAQVEPANANNKRVTWTIDDETIATVQNGKVTGVKPGETVVHATTQEGLFTADATVIIKEKPPVKYPDEVLAAEANYKMEDYTIPSYIEFMLPKYAAKIDSLDPDNEERLPSIAGNIQLMNAAIEKLQPKEQPYNQIATIYGDPATHMGFCWFTNGGIKDGVVQLLPQADATVEDFETCDCLITLHATTQDAHLHYAAIQPSEGKKYNICEHVGLPDETMFDYVSHKALAEDLTPGTTYSWRVGYEGHWSDIAQFVTKDAEQGDFSFLYMTDSHIQDSIYIREARRCAEAVVKNESDVKFCLFPGDFVDTGGKTNGEWQWERWFHAIRPVLNNMTIVPTDGNHDDSPSLNYDYHFNTDWSFANAAEVKPQFHGITYSFVYGDVLFLVFSMQDWWRESGTDENIMKSTYLSVDVRNWFLDQIEAHPNTKYRVTLSHKNVFSGAGHHEDDECTLLRHMMLPIMKECEIDLAIQGHDHCYEVIGPIDSDTRKVVPGSVTDTIHALPEATGRWERKENKTGIEGGTFTTDDGTLYFIGATCGNKRYEPYSRYVMDTAYTTNPALLYDNHHHNVENLFDLFTSKFGQPGAPSYTRFNVSDNGIEVVTYMIDAEGNKTAFNTINVKRSHRHGEGTGVESTKFDASIPEGEKFIRNGQLFIRKDGRTYNILGKTVK